MSFHIKDDFKAGAPISQVPASWFNSVAKFLNGLVGGFAIGVEKHESGRSTIGVKRNVLQSEIENIVNGIRVSKEAGTPDDRTDTGADDDSGGDTWTWTAGGAKGLKMDAYFCCVDEDGWHYLQRARLTISKDGLIVKAEGLPGRREIKA